MSVWQEKIEAAFAKRARLLSGEVTDSVRLFHGYGDGQAGVAIEKFADLAIVEYRRPIQEQLDAIKRALLSVYPFQAIVGKGHQSLGGKLRHRLKLLHGEVDEAAVVAHEHGLRYRIHGMAPHNAGLYLDARPARKWLLENSRGRRILNLFAFTGSLGLASRVGGAVAVYHVDRSQEAVRRIGENYALNGQSLDSRDVVRGDLYRHLSRAVKAGHRFDGIILDPPPQVYSGHRKSTIKGQDFPHLTTLCGELLAPGAWMMCLFHRFEQSLEEFEGQVERHTQTPVEAIWRCTSEEDFADPDPQRRLRITVYGAA